MSLPERPLSVALQLATEMVAVEPEKEYVIAGIYSFGRGLIRRPTIRGSETAYTRLGCLRAGQFTMSKLNGWEGALTIVPDEFDGLYVSPEYPVFDIDTDVADPTYLAYLAKWPSLWDRLTPRGSMVRRKRIVPATLLATSVPLPDLPEQRRIATRLDRTFGKVARARQLHAHRADLRGAYRESVITEASRVATESVQIKNILTLKRRQVFLEAKASYREVGIRSFGRGIFHKDPVTGDQIGDKRVFSIEPGDLLFSNVFAWEGAVALAGTAESGMIGSHRFMTYVVNDSLADAGYLKHYFTSEAGLEIIRRASPGSAGRNRTLGIKTFDEQWFQLPDPRMQQHIRERLDTIATRRMYDDLETLDALSRSLLNSAFGGEL
jgi:type I restriction enzyme S subunit